MILILFKASVVITTLIIFYKLFLEKESFFATNRIYLLSCILLTIILPFVSIPKMVDHQGILTNWSDISDSKVISKAIDKDRLDLETTGLFVLGQNKKQIIKESNQSKGISYYLSIIYLLGVFIFLTIFLKQVYNLMKVIYQTEDKVKAPNCTIVNISTKIEPCSFFRYVFISPDYYDKKTYEHILKHEQTHVRLCHSLDLILAELTKIILWFNPFVWQFRREVEKNIEYQTDQILINDDKLDNQFYQMSLLSLGTKIKPMSLVTNFNQSLIKQRIFKMNSKKSNPVRFCKYAFTLPLIFTLLLIVNQPLTSVATDINHETTKTITHSGDTDESITQTFTKQDEISQNKNTEVFVSKKVKTQEKETLENLKSGDKKKDSNLIKTDRSELKVRPFESTRDTLENFKLHQNTPNPVQSETVIGFDLPKAAFVKLVFSNVEGKAVKTVEGNFEKGYNKIQFSKSDFENDSKYTGILYYQLEYEKHTLARKMILIEKK